MRSTSKRNAPLLSAFTLSSLVASLSAGTITWNGSGDGTNWTDASNWIGAIAPTDDTTTDIAQWSGGIELDTDRSVNGIDFTGGAQLNDTGGDNTLTLGSGGIDVTGGGNGDIYTDVVFAADSTITLSNRRLSFRDTSAHSGSGNVTITGGNIAYFDVAASTRTGGTTVTGGARVSIKGSSALGSGSLTLDNGTVEENRSAFSWSNDVVVNAGGGTLKLNGDFSSTYTGSGALTIVGSGTTSDKTISADGSGHSGGVILDNVKFRTTNNAAYGTGTITLSNNAVIKNNNNSLSLDNDIVVDASGGGFEIGWNNRIISVNGSISGAGKLTVNNDSSTLRLYNSGGSNTYSGGTEIQGVVWSQTGTLGTGDVTLNAVTAGRGSLKNLNGAVTHSNNFIIDGTNSGGKLSAGWNADLTLSGVVSGSGNLEVEGDSGRVVWSNTGNSFTGNIDLTDEISRMSVSSLGEGTYGGVISGSGTFEYSGTGSQTLTAVSTYTGATTVSAGTLVVNGDISSSNGVTVQDGAAIGGSGITGSLTVQSGAAINPGNSPGVLQTASLTLAGTYNAEAVGGTTAGIGYDQIEAAGTVDLTGATLALDITGTYSFGDELILINNDGVDAITGTFTGLSEGDSAGTNGVYDLIVSYQGGDGNDFVVAVIPEPSSSMLAALGALALVRRRRRA